MTVSLRKKSLLVVDDNAPILQYVQRLGDGFGFDVTTSVSREDALEKIAAQRFDVAFIDMRLVEHDTNNRDGLALIEYLRELGEGTRTYLMTGYANAHDVRAAWHAGATDAILKELDLPGTEMALTQALTAEMQQTSDRRHVRGPRAFCGNEVASNWEVSVARDILHAETGTLMHLLNELALTCDPILERVEDNGMQEIAQGAIGGLYWSRGFGQCVVVVVAKGDPPPPLPHLQTWPADLIIDDKPVISRPKDHLRGSIHAAHGLTPARFTVRREIWEK